MPSVFLQMLYYSSGVLRRAAHSKKEIEVELSKKLGKK